VFAKIISELINNLLGRCIAFITAWVQKRKVIKLENQVTSLKDKVTILEHEKKTQKKISDWKYRLEHKEADSLVNELNKIRKER